MPVTFRPAAHSATPVPFYEGYDNAAPDAFLGHMSRNLADKMGKILQSSFFATSEWVPSPDSVRPQRTGLVGTVMAAYNTHHALIIRPDDVWLTILWCVEICPW